MAKLFKRIRDFLTGVTSATHAIMQNEIADRMVEHIQQVARDEFYSYEPEFYSRREESGGMIDPNTMHVDYDRKSQTLHIQLDAEYQNKGFQYTTGSGQPDMPLADFVQNYQVYNAPPRPFLEEAKRDYVANYMEADLEEALHRRGF